MSHTRRVLVTGGAGFIGSHVADRFLAEGYSVVVLDDLSSGERDNVPAAAEFHQADVRSPETQALVRGGGFTVIAHLAAQIDVRKSVSNPLHDLAVNVGGTVGLLEAVRTLPEKDRPRVVFASTGGALYGDAALAPTPETAPANPDSPYGINKLASEHYLAYYARVWGLDTISLRFGNVYGPRQNGDGDAGVVAIFARLLLAHQPLIIYGTGEQTRDFVHVSDIASAFLAACSKDIPSNSDVADRAFNVGTGIETSIVRLAHEMAAIARVPGTIRHEPARPGEVSRSSLDARKFSEQFGWRASVSLREGLADTYSWLAGRAVSGKSTA